MRWTCLNLTALADESPRFPRGIGTTKIPTAVHAEKTWQTRSEGPFTGRDSRECTDNNCGSSFLSLEKALPEPVSLAGLRMNTNSPQTGAGTTPLAHFRTQLPYALTNGALALAGFMVSGHLQIAWIAIAAVAGQAAILLVVKRRSAAQSKC